MKPKIVATARRITIGRQDSDGYSGGADHEIGDDLDREENGEPDHQVSTCPGEREPEDREVVETAEAGRGAAVAHAQERCEHEEPDRDEELGRPRPALPLRRERDQAGAEHRGGGDLAPVPVGRGQCNEAERDRDGDDRERECPLGDTVVQDRALVVTHLHRDEVTHVNGVPWARHSA